MTPTEAAEIIRALMQNIMMTQDEHDAMLVALDALQKETQRESGE